MITESETQGEHDAPCNIIPSVQVIQVPLGGRHTMNEPPLLWSPDLVLQERALPVTEGRHFEGEREQKPGHDPLFSDYTGAARLSPHLIQTISSQSEL